ncbi:MAG: substrate-binding domain-containing protein [Nitrospirae bacterium]|nr:substrate-binding domain-containing protein [Nitrospirota bacterium]
MKMRLYLVTVLIFFLALGSSHAAEKEKITIAGAGGMIPLLTELARVYMIENKDVMLVVKQTAIHSSGGISGVADGTYQIGLSNRPLREDEKSKGLEASSIALVGVVAAVNKALPVRELSSENLCRIYEGKLTDWSELGLPAGKINAVTKSETDLTKEIIRRSIPCFKNLKEAASVVVIQSSPEMQTALLNSKSIGFTDTVDIAASNGRIVPLKLDGIEPSNDNLKSGKYKITQTGRLITKGKPSGAVKNFIDFIHGPKGRQIIENSHAIAVK